MNDFRAVWVKRTSPNVARVGDVMRVSAAPGLVVEFLTVVAVHPFLIVRGEHIGERVVRREQVSWPKA